MPSARKIRRFAAVLLLCAAFLPLGQCSRYSGAPPPRPTTILQWMFPRDDSAWHYDYAVKWVDFSFGGALTVLAFVWPLLFIVLFRWVEKPRRLWLLRTLELLLCAGTVYWTYLLLGFDEHWLYGAYVTLLAILLYASSIVFPALFSARAFYLRRRTRAVEFG